MHILSSVVPSMSPRSSPPAGTGTGTDETFTEYKHCLVTQVVRKDNNFTSVLQTFITPKINVIEV